MLKLVRYKKLSEKAVVPMFGSEGAAGADLTATSRGRLKNGIIEYGTGIAVAIPTNCVGLLFPRSSISKMDMNLANAVGVIDSDYRGEIRIRMRILNTTDENGISSIGDLSKIYKVGERIGQLVIVPIPKIRYNEVQTLPDTDRGKGGFGSTGD